MAGGIYRGIIVPHAPRMGLPEIVPDFQKEVVQGIHDIGADVRADAPDVIVICSTHYVSTFNWHASTVARHQGHCVAMEAPEMIGGEPYDYPGDPELGQAIVDGITGRGFPCVPNDSTHYSWDYGTWVPVHYMDPDAGIPLVTIPVVLEADHEECFAVGEVIHEACVATGRRAIFAASTALSHKLVRNPPGWPREDRMAADAEFIGKLLEGRLTAAWDGFTEYAQFVVAEMYGRPLATFLGALMAAGIENWETKQFGPYAQSSGSGNVNVSLKAA